MNKNTLGIPIAIIVANFFLSLLMPAGIVANAIYNVIRAATTAYAGWLVVQRGGKGIWTAALAGLLLFAIDHIALRGGTFLFDAYILNKTPSENVSAFGGVLVSYVMFAVIAALVAIAGGLASRWMSRR